MIPLDALGGIVASWVCTALAKHPPHSTLCPKPNTVTTAINPIEPASSNDTGDDYRLRPQPEPPPQVALALSVKSLIPQGSVLDLLVTLPQPHTPFEFTHLAPVTLPTSDGTTHGTCTCVIGISCLNSVWTHADPSTSSLMDGGANICITNDISNLMDAVPVPPFLLSVTTKSAKPTLGERCTVWGLLALPTTTGNTIYQPCYFCKQAIETIISPDVILKSNNKLDQWVQISHKGDAPGLILFCGPSPDDTFTIHLTKCNGLYYCPLGVGLHDSPTTIKTASTFCIATQMPPLPTQ
jgi:hypothetical protein